MERVRAARLIISGAYAAFLVANLIHNRFAVDAAVVPSGIFVALSFWKPNRALVIAAAICIALPALGFFKLGAILQSPNTLYLFNHLFLLLSGLLACAAAIVSIVPARQRKQV